MKWRYHISASSMILPNNFLTDGRRLISCPCREYLHPRMIIVNKHNREDREEGREEEQREGGRGDMDGEYTFVV